MSERYLSGSWWCGLRGAEARTRQGYGQLGLGLWGVSRTANLGGVKDPARKRTLNDETGVKMEMGKEEDAPVLESAALLYEEALSSRRFISCQSLVVFYLDRSMEKRVLWLELQL